MENWEWYAENLALMLGQWASVSQTVLCILLFADPGGHSVCIAAKIPRIHYKAAQIREIHKKIDELQVSSFLLRIGQNHPITMLSGFVCVLHLPKR